MLFTFSITAPANTPKTSPAKLEMKLKAGTVTKISVLIPTGHGALAHLAILHGETQIIPWGDGQWIEGDSETLPWEPDYELPSEPARLEARAWNEDDTYSHTFYIRIEVKPKREEPSWSVINEAARDLSRFVKRLMGR